MAASTWGDDGAEAGPERPTVDAVESRKDGFMEDVK
jgi:hypothetical protein